MCTKRQTGAYEEPYRALWIALPACRSIWNAHAAPPDLRSAIGAEVFLALGVVREMAALYNSEYAAACKKISSTWETLC